MARREGTTVDSIISIALSSQVTAWKVRDTFEQRAARALFRVAGSHPETVLEARHR